MTIDALRMLYRAALPLGLINLVLGLAALVIVAGGREWPPALVLLVALGPVLSWLFACAHEAVHAGHLPVRRAWALRGGHVRRGLAIATLLVVGGAVLLANVRIALSDPSPVTAGVGALSLWALLCLAACAPWWWSRAVAAPRTPLRTILQSLPPLPIAVWTVAVFAVSFILVAPLFTVAAALVALTCAQHVTQSSRSALLA